MKHQKKILDSEANCPLINANGDVEIDGEAAQLQRLSSPGLDSVGTGVLEVSGLGVQPLGSHLLVGPASTAAPIDEECEGTGLQDFV